MALISGVAVLMSLRNSIEEGSEIVYNYSKESNEGMAWRNLNLRNPGDWISIRETLFEHKNQKPHFMVLASQRNIFCDFCYLEEESKKKKHFEDIGGRSSDFLSCMEIGSSPTKELEYDRNLHSTLQEEVVPIKNLPLTNLTNSTYKSSDDSMSLLTNNSIFLVQQENIDSSCEKTITLNLKSLSEELAIDETGIDYENENSLLTLEEAVNYELIESREVLRTLEKETLLSSNEVPAIKKKKHCSTATVSSKDSSLVSTAAVTNHIPMPAQVSLVNAPIFFPRNELSSSKDSVSKSGILVTTKKLEDTEVLPAMENKILNDAAINDKKKQCPIEGCNSQVQELSKHLRFKHKLSDKDRKILSIQCRRRNLNSGQKRPLRKCPFCSTLQTRCTSECCTQND